MSYIVSMIAIMATRIIAATMGLFFYYLLFRLIFRRNPGKPPEIHATEQIFYPVRFYVPALKLAWEYVSLVIFMISWELWVLNYWAAGKDFAIAFLAFALIISLLPFEKKVKRVIVSAGGITLEYRKGGSAHFASGQLVGCKGKCLYFEDLDGARKKVKLAFLCREDRQAVMRDLERRARTGEKMNDIEQCREWTGFGLKEAPLLYENPGDPGSLMLHWIYYWRNGWRCR